VAWMATPGSDSRAAVRRAGGRPRHSTNQSEQNMSFWQVWVGGGFVSAVGNRPIGRLSLLRRGRERQRVGGRSAAAGSMSSACPTKHMELKAHQEAWAWAVRKKTFSPSYTQDLSKQTVITTRHVPPPPPHPKKERENTLAMQYLSGLSRLTFSDVLVLVCLSAKCKQKLKDTT